jgi:hypothetical protein
VVGSWKWVSILLTFEQFIESETIINIKVVIFVALIKFGGLFENQVTHQIMCLGVDGTSTFQGV